MTVDNNPTIKFGDLIIYPRLGVIENTNGDSLRLGPINMKVLETLVSQPGEVVSRNVLFEGVWPNQVVSDDALTRCISDIRSSLSQLSPGTHYIETVPKRGYRWLEVETGSTEPNQSTPNKTTSVYARRLGSSIIYLVAALVLISFGIWLTTEYLVERPPRIALLPTNNATTTQLQVALSVQKFVNDELLKRKEIEVLSQRAVATSPANPFPYLYYEFGVQWLIEVRVTNIEENISVNFELLDARTGVVLASVNEQVKKGTDEWRRLAADFVETIEPILNE